jgi:hypothetical protein
VQLPAGKGYRSQGAAGSLFLVILHYRWTAALSRKTILVDNSFLTDYSITVVGSSLSGNIAGSWG